MNETKFGPLPEDRADSANESMGRPWPPQSGIGYPRGAHPFPFGERMPGQGNPAVKMPFGEAGAVPAPDASHFGVSYMPDDALHPEHPVADQRPGVVPVPPGFPGYPGAVPMPPGFPGYPGYSGASPATAGAPSPVRKAAVPDPSGNPGAGSDPSVSTGSCRGSYPGDNPDVDEPPRGSRAKAGEYTPGRPRDVTSTIQPIQPVMGLNPASPETQQAYPGGYPGMPAAPARYPARFPQEDIHCEPKCFWAQKENFGVCELRGIHSYEEINVIYDNVLYSVKDSYLTAEYTPARLPTDKNGNITPAVMASILMFHTSGRHYYLIAVGAEGSKLDDGYGNEVPLGTTPIFIPLTYEAAMSFLERYPCTKGGRIETTYYPSQSRTFVTYDNGNFIFRDSKFMFVLASDSPRHSLFSHKENVGWFTDEEHDDEGIYMGESYLHYMTPGEMKHWAWKNLPPDKFLKVFEEVELFYIHGHIPDYFPC